MCILVVLVVDKGNVCYTNIICVLFLCSFVVDKGNVFVVTDLNSGNIRKSYVHIIRCTSIVCFIIVSIT